MLKSVGFQSKRNHGGPPLGLEPSQLACSIHSQKSHTIEIGHGSRQPFILGTLGHLPRKIRIRLKKLMADERGVWTQTIFGNRERKFTRFGTVIESYPHLFQSLHSRLGQ